MKYVSPPIVYRFVQKITYTVQNYYTVQDNCHTKRGKKNFKIHTNVWLHCLSKMLMYLDIQKKLALHCVEKSKEKSPNFIFTKGRHLDNLMTWLFRLESII